jgi:hypothetical protein
VRLRAYGTSLCFFPADGRRGLQGEPGNRGARWQARGADPLTQTPRGSCVEVADDSGVILVRDTTDRDGGTWAISADA